MRRYVLGPKVELPVEAAPVRPGDVVPDVRWSDDGKNLVIDVRPYDPAAERPPAEVRIYAIPEFSPLFDAPADAIVADSSLSFSAAELAHDPTGVVGYPILLPTYPKGARRIGQVIYGYDDPEPDDPGPSAES